MLKLITLEGNYYGDGVKWTFFEDYISSLKKSQIDLFAFKFEEGKKGGS